ncbi:hypothetical protein EDD11_003271 [Mortierella claussenii]|nr:hypothetical protein EDD11_003271 [Mortierella claussenii]
MDDFHSRPEHDATASTESSIPHSHTVQSSAPPPTLYPSFASEQLHQQHSPPQPHSQHASSAQQEPQQVHPSVSATTSPYDDAPPTYEAVIIKDALQIHDNYEHLRGPPGQRGADIKGPIPVESLPSSAYYQSGGSFGGHGIGSSSTATLAAGSSSSSSSSSGPGAYREAPKLSFNTLGVHVEDVEEGDFAQDVDRLLGPQQSGNSSENNSVGAVHMSINQGGIEEEEYEREGSTHEDDSCWSVAGDEQAWAALGYMTILLLPWAVFCYAWTLIWALTAACTMIIPPLGYLFTIFSVTTWRALARADLVVSAALVSNNVRKKYPYIPAQIFIAPEPEPGPPAWTPPRLFGFEIPLPVFIREKLEKRHVASHHRRRRSARRRNMWARGSKHLTATMDRHTYASLVYFLVWKMIFAMMAFLMIWLMFSITLPFTICLLPTLLKVSKTLANWQYRWAVNWLSEKPAPIVLAN